MGSWAGRYGPNEECPGEPYFWANQTDTLRGTTSRDHTLARWAADLQNDFRVRMDWCMNPREQANHRPVAVVNHRPGSEFLRLNARAGSGIELNAAGSSDPDGDALAYEWLVAQTTVGAARGPQRVTLDLRGARLAAGSCELRAGIAGGAPTATAPMRLVASPWQGKEP